MRNDLSTAPYGLPPFRIRIEEIGGDGTRSATWPRSARGQWGYANNRGCAEEVKTRATQEGITGV
jgi:hypothetical protein